MARRLLGSYLAVIAVTVILLALIVQFATAQTFSRYLSDQSTTHSEMLPVMLAGYYTAHGAWDGVQEDIDHASLLIGAQVALADAQGRVVAASERTLVGLQDAGGHALGLPMPVEGSGGAIIGTAYVGRSLEQQRADQSFLTSVTRALIGAGVAAALLASALGLLLARSISRPLAEMGQAAERIAQGDYAVRVPSRASDEVSALAAAFNHMAEGMGSVEKLRRELVANVSHDLRTPLTVIRGYLEGLRSGQIADRRSAEVAFEAMDTEVAQLLYLVEDLRQVAAADAGTLPLKRHPVPVAELARTSMARVARLAAAKGVTLVDEVPLGLPLLDVDSARMGQALFNLLENAIRHTPSGGRVRVRAGQTAGADRQQAPIYLTMQDNGEGIAPEHLPHLFERFYSVDRARSRADGGSGLGLAIVRAIVEAHGGLVYADSDGVPGHGSTFTVQLPVKPLEDL